MTWLEYEIFALSVLIAAVIAVFKLRVADRCYLPFFVLLWAASINEILSIVLVYVGGVNALSNNIYVLVESLTLLWFFWRLKTVSRNIFLFIALATVYVVVWVVDNLIVRNISLDISYYFRILYSFVTVIFSITTVNYMIITEKKVLMKLPIFLICLGFIVYFTYKVLVEAFELYGLNESSTFQLNVYTILIYLNLCINLLYALAVIWIRKKPGFSLLS